MASDIDFLILCKIGKVRAHDSFKNYVEKYDRFSRLGRSHMTAAAKGFELSRSPLTAMA